MLDLSNIGRAGMIIQYEDIISMIGFNVARYLRSKGMSNKLDSMSVEDVLLSYINREDEDYSIWLKKEFDIDINPKDYLSSFLTMQPNLLYSYKVFTTSHREKIDSLYIYSNQYSPIAEQAVDSYGFGGIKYIHGNLEEFLKEHPNSTYLTSSVDNIKKCAELSVPMVLIICDDYMYISDIFSSKLVDKLKENSNIVLRFTGVISAGIIN
jgi:hypothetical protein